MIAGMENNIAFKAEDAFGQPKKISGILYDQTGKALFNFNSTHNGMGKFLLVPEKQDVFYAVWKDEKGIEHRTDLPPVKSSGIALRSFECKSEIDFFCGETYGKSGQPAGHCDCPHEPANGL